MIFLLQSRAFKKLQFIILIMRDIKKFFFFWNIVLMEFVKIFLMFNSYFTNKLKITAFSLAKC
jgi:hypothetical protein